MKKLFTIIIIVFTYSLIQAESNFLPILNEDYVWYFVKKGNNSPDNCSTAKLWLDGDTIINEKAYKKCWSYGLDTVVNPQVIALEAFMREEDGKVWMLVNNPPLTDLPRILRYGDKSIETCIYDLNLNVGDSLYIKDFYVPFYKTFYIKSVGKEIIKGVERKTQIITPWPESDYGDVKVIEGIGCCSDPKRRSSVSGYLPFPYTVNYLSSDSFPECYLEKIENKAGDVIIGYNDLNTVNIVNNENLEVYGENGTIIIKGNYTTCNIMNINGCSVSSFTRLASGIYIAVVDDRPYKVMIK